MSMPEGAQLSEDGQYWWDGAEWQPVQGGGDGSGGLEYGARSDDGQYWWDGSDWQPMEGESEEGSGEEREFDFEPEWVPTIMELAGYSPDESGAKDYLASLGADEAAISGDAVA